MKSRIMLLICAVSIFGAVSHAKDDRLKPTEVVLQPKYAFFPPGFDSNDNAQVVISGYMPNTCFKALPPEVTVNRQDKKVVVKNKALFFSGCFCLEVLVPYNHVIDLNVLEAGGYAFVTTDDRGREIPWGAINIAQATGLGPDNSPYAPIDSISAVEVSPGNFDLEIKGHYLSRCMTHKEISVLKRANNIIEVLPYIDIATNSWCRDPGDPFEFKVHLGTDLNAATLIHVRALNGQSFNQVINLN